MDKSTDRFMFTVAIDHDRSEGTHKNIEVIFRLFQEGDHIDIAILRPDANTIEVAEISKQVSEVPCHFTNPAPFRVVTDPLEIDDIHNRAHIILGDPPIADDILFDHYKQCVTAKNLSAYEGDTIVDIYDCEKIREARLQNPGSTGSTNLNFFQNYVQWIETRLKEEPGHIRILDVGCGAGAFFYVLKKYFSKQEIARISYLGIDLSRSQVMRARRLFPEAEFNYGHADVYELGEQTFDIIVMNSVLPFNPPEIQVNMLEKTIKHSDGHFFAGVSCQAHEVGYPVPEQMVSTSISQYTAEPQLEYILTQEQVERVVRRLGCNNFHSEHIIEFFNEQQSKVTFRSNHAQYAEMRRLMEDKRKTQGPPSGTFFYNQSSHGCPMITSDYGPGKLFESYTVNFFPPGFTPHPEQSRIGTDFNVLFDRI